MPKGGHFAALEQPDLLVKDKEILLGLYEFIRIYKKITKSRITFTY